MKLCKPVAVTSVAMAATVEVCSNFFFMKLICNDQYEVCLQYAHYKNKLMIVLKMLGQYFDILIIGHKFAVCVVY